MRVLITGASGFVGSWLARTGAAEGHSIFCGLREQSDPSRIRALELRWPDRVHRVALDVIDPESLDRAIGAISPEVIIHTAAYGVDSRQQDPITGAETNIMGTLRVWEGAHKFAVPRLVHIGTSYEYGSHVERIAESTPRDPAGMYGKTKAAASALIRECGEMRDPNPLIFWLFGVFGPGEGRHKLVPQIIEAAKAGSPLTLTAGTQQRDYLFVADAARAIMAVATLPDSLFPKGEGFNLCSGEGVSVREFATRIAAHFGAEAVLRFGCRIDRAEGGGSVVGDPSRWLTFCSNLELTTLARKTPVERALDTWSNWDF